MTGRRLYDLFCDAWAGIPEWHRESSTNTLGLSKNPVAWPFLSYAEKRIFTSIAARMKGVRR